MVRLIRGDESVAGMKAPDLFKIPAELGLDITASLTLDRSYLGRFWSVNSASPVVITVPPDTSSVAYIEGESFIFYHEGAGTVALAQGAGVTIVGPGLNSQGQYNALAILRSATLNKWYGFHLAA